MAEADYVFCSCGSMMFPKNGVYVCNSCGATKEIGGKVEVIDGKKVEKKEMAVFSDGMNTDTLPKTRIPCPKCNYNEAYFVIRQTRSADEPETRIYRCCKCQYSWREY